MSEKHSLTDPERWAHCPGRDNPADLITRGIFAEKLISCSVWFAGPDWLKESGVSGDGFCPSVTCCLRTATAPPRADPAGRLGVGLFVRPSPPGWRAERPHRGAGQLLDKILKSQIRSPNQNVVVSCRATYYTCSWVIWDEELDGDIHFCIWPAKRSTSGQTRPN